MSETMVADTLSQVSSRILEDAAFVFTDLLDPQQRPDVDSWSAEGASLEFSGEKKGVLHMWASEGFARYAAANMLGIDEDAEDAGQKGMDALKELLNMVVGNFLTDLYGEEPIFDLGLPEPLPREALAGDVASEQGVWLEAEGNAVLFTVTIED